MPNLKSPQTLIAVSLLAAVAFVSCQPKPAAVAPTQSETESVAEDLQEQGTTTQQPPALMATDSASDLALGEWVKTGDNYDITTHYLTPGGPEEIEFNVTMSNGAIAGVIVTPHGKSPTTQKMQGQFKAAAAEALVGKKLADLTKVDRIGGASLSTGAFNKVLESLKAQAL